jgi:hypothetical protein
MAVALLRQQLVARAAPGGMAVVTFRMELVAEAALGDMEIPSI